MWKGASWQGLLNLYLFVLFALQVINSESALGELKNKFYDLQKSARDVCDDTHDLSLIENELSGKDQEQDCIKKLRKLHDDVLKVKVSCQYVKLYM